ncbi:hypothetical protein ACGC1H_000199 [Rhizoctonia solani]
MTKDSSVSRHQRHLIGPLPNHLSRASPLPVCALAFSNHRWRWRRIEFITLLVPRPLACPEVEARPLTSRRYATPPRARRWNSLPPGSFLTYNLPLQASSSSLRRRALMSGLLSSCKAPRWKRFSTQMVTTVATVQ